MTIKYQSQMEGIEALGGTDKARATFIAFQKQLYRKVAEQAALHVASATDKREV